MLDINLLRISPQLVKESLHKRGKNIDIVDMILDVDKKWRENQIKINKLRNQKNIKISEVDTLKLKNSDATVLIEEVKKINAEIKGLERDVNDLKEKRFYNIV